MIINNYNMQPPTPTPLPIPPSGFGDADVIFIDYDGTVLASYTASEFASLSALPENPSHIDIGLVAQGWNWTRADIQAQLTVTPYQTITVGQLYTTLSGDTEIDITLTDYFNPYLGVAVNGTVEIDWGDSSQNDVISGTSLTKQIRTMHLYSNAGNYTIKIHTISGEYAFYSSTIGSLLLSDSDISWGESSALKYTTTINAVRIGNGCNNIGKYGLLGLMQCKYITIPNNVILLNNCDRMFYDCYSLQGLVLPNNAITIYSYMFQYCISLKHIATPINTTYNIGSYAFDRCYSLTNIFIQTASQLNAYTFRYCNWLKKITIPNNTQIISQDVFTNCVSLEQVIIPNSVTSIMDRAFYGCEKLKSIVLPNSITSLGMDAFRECKSLTNVVLPNNITEIPQNCFYGCYCLKNIVIPDSVTRISKYAFGDCSSLHSITIPPNVTSMSNFAFSSCRGIRELYLKPQTPPVLDSPGLANIGTPVIYVPQGCLEAYQTAANWSGLASQMQEEPA